VTLSLGEIHSCDTTWTRLVLPRQLMASVQAQAGASGRMCHTLRGRRPDTIRSPLLVATDTEQDGATRIGMVRMAVGALPLAAPGLARVLFGLPKTDDTPTVRTVARLFAIRNLVLGLWVLSVRDADVGSRRRCHQLNAAVDALDVLVLVWPVVRRQGLIRFGLGSATLAVSATLAWLELLRRQQASPTTAAPAWSTP